MGRQASLQIKLHPDLTLKQKEILKYPGKHLILTGPAGTAKTYMALARGLKAIKEKEVQQIVIIRSAVEIRPMGFLPGDANEKMEIYAAPYIHNISKLSPQKNYRALYAAKELDFLSTSYLRGATFDNTFIIVDEYQNMSAHELETISTRVGENSHLVLCGDSDQSDLKYNEAKEHKEIIQILSSMDVFGVFTFDIEDIVRSEFVHQYYEAKEALHKAGLLNTLKA